jgi:hypothetical protein
MFKRRVKISRRYVKYPAWLIKIVPSCLKFISHNVPMFLIALLVRTSNEKLMYLSRRLLLEEKTLEMTEEMFKMKLKGKN